MNCQACKDQPSHATNRSCRRCQIREIARGPHFFASMRAGKLTAEYLRQLGEVQGVGDYGKAHEEVKAMAKSTEVGSIKA